MVPFAPLATTRLVDRPWRLRRPALPRLHHALCGLCRQTEPDNPEDDDVGHLFQPESEARRNTEASPTAAPASPIQISVLMRISAHLLAVGIDVGDIIARRTAPATRWHGGTAKVSTRRQQRGHSGLKVIRCPTSTVAPRLHWTMFSAANHRGRVYLPKSFNSALTRCFAVRSIHFGLRTARSTLQPLQSTFVEASRLSRDA
jgi:hypothetical protein